MCFFAQVSSIVGRTELLCSIFFLLSLLAYQKTSSLTQRATQARKNSKINVWLFLTIFFSMLSLLSKEQGITVFGVCAAYEILLVMNFDLSDCLKSLIHFPRILRDPSLRVSLHRLLALLISCITLLCGRLYLNGREPPLFVESDNPASFSSHWPTRALTYMYLWGLNMWLLVFPSGLCFDWSMGSIPLVETLWDCRNVLTVTILLMLISLLFKGTYMEKLKITGNNETVKCVVHISLFESVWVRAVKSWPQVLSCLWLVGVILHLALLVYKAITIELFWLRKANVQVLQ